MAFTNVKPVDKPGSLLGTYFHIFIHLYTSDISLSIFKLVYPFHLAFFRLFQIFLIFLYLILVTFIPTLSGRSSGTHYYNKNTLHPTIPLHQGSENPLAPSEHLSFLLASLQPSSVDSHLPDCQHITVQGFTEVLYYRSCHCTLLQCVGALECCPSKCSPNKALDAVF